MFSNIGTKIKTLAQILCWLGVIGTVVGGLVLMGNDGTSGFVVLFVGPPLSWVASFFLYGLGQLIENTDKMVAIQSNSAGTVAPLSQADKINKLQILKEMQQQRLVTHRDIEQAKEGWEA